MAWMICDGAARNSGLAISTRLTNSQSRSQPTTDSTPAMLYWRRRSDMSVANLRDAGQEQPVDGEIARHVAQLLQGSDQPCQFRAGHLSGRLEIVALNQEIVG